MRHVAKGRPVTRKRHLQRKPTEQARAGMLNAWSVLYSDAPGLSGEAALAERDRLRAEDEAKASMQIALPLRLAP